METGRKVCWHVYPSLDFRIFFKKKISPLVSLKHHYSPTRLPCPFRIFNFNCFGSRGQFCKSCGAVIIRMWHIYTQRVYKNGGHLPDCFLMSARQRFSGIFSTTTLVWNPRVNEKDRFYRTFSCEIKYYYSTKMYYLVDYFLTLVSAVIWTNVIVNSCKRIVVLCTWWQYSKSFILENLPNIHFYMS